MNKMLQVGRISGFLVIWTLFLSILQSETTLACPPAQDPSAMLPTPSPGDSNQPLILTPLIRLEQTQLAKDMSRVNNLTNTLSYSGFFQVNPVYDSNIFFWFFPATSNPENKPLLVWLQGGPGASSLLALFNENGPFVVDSGNNLSLRNTTWTSTHSILYIDNPVGAGFSFTRNDKGYARDQNDVARDLYEALKQFFKMFKEYQKNDFYLTGQSYAGKYIPAIATKIHEENKKAGATKINMKGIMIGNGLTDPISMLDYGDYLYTIGMLDYKSKMYFDKVEDEVRGMIQQDKFLDAFKTMDKLLLGWHTGPSFYEQQTGFRRYYNILQSTDPPEFDYFISFVQQNSVRKSIHVGNQSFKSGFTFEAEQNLQGDIYKSVKPLIEQLLNAPESYKVLIYNGQLDIIVPSVFTDRFIRTLKWKGAYELASSDRKMWRVGKDIAGYYKTVGSFTQLVVRNAGHSVPSDQPEWSLKMLNAFTSGKGF